MFLLINKLIIILGNKKYKFAFFVCSIINQVFGCVFLLFIVIILFTIARSNVINVACSFNEVINKQLQNKQN